MFHGTGSRPRIDTTGVEFVLQSPRRPGASTDDWRSVNLGTQFGKILKRVGLVAWPRAWLNLRSSRQTELTEKFPSHLVTAWLSYSERIAEKHYLQVLDSHFERASAPVALQRRCGTRPKRSAQPRNRAARQMQNPLFCRENQQNKGFV